VKFSIAYVKQNPVMFGAIFIVFGLLLYWLISHRGAGAGSSSVIVAGGGQSDAQIAAAAQIQLAQIGTAGAAQQAQYQLAALQYSTDSQERMGALGLQAQLASIQADSNNNQAAIAASLAALQIQTTAQSQIVDSNNQFMVDYASIAAGSATQQLLINATLQRDLGAQQLDAYKYSTSINAIQFLKKKDRDNALAGMLGYTIPNDPQRTGGGGGGLLGVLAGIVAPLPALVSKVI
jgi:hypothetical protein